MFRSFAAALLLALTLALPVRAEEAPAATPAAPAATFTPAQRAEIESIVKDYLLREPAVLSEAMDVLQVQMQARQEAEQNKMLQDNLSKIEDPGTVPVAGNPKGDVTVVEFFDYKCGYCRAMAPVVDRLLQEDKNIRLIYKEFPILGHVSTQAARYALAARNQGKYLEMHNKFMAADTKLEVDTLPGIAKELGLDMDRVNKDLLNQEILTELRSNLELGGAINIRGTPAFVVGGRLYPGALDLDQLKQAVADARAAAKSPAPAPATP